MSLGHILTMDEAAERLRISRRSLQELVKSHPHYAANGRKKLFSEGDIAALWEAMRCRSNLSDARDQTIGMSGVLSEAKLYSRARELIGKRRRNPSASA